MVSGGQESCWVVMLECSAYLACVGDLGVYRRSEGMVGGYA